MPRGAAPQRADEMAALEHVLHERRMNPRVGEWLAATEADGGLGAPERAQLRHIRRTFERTTRLPASLAAELARTTSRAQGTWAEARKSDDFAAFASTLERVVALKREEATALADGGDLYDALLDDYEPGATGAFLDDLFGALRPRLVALRERILGAERRPPVLTGDFEERAQLALSSELALAFGYDLAHGRIDKAVHPFSSGSGLDVRITTRTEPGGSVQLLLLDDPRGRPRHLRAGDRRRVRADPARAAASRWAFTRARAASTRTSSAAVAPSLRSCTGACSRRSAASESTTPTPSMPP